MNSEVEVAKNESVVFQRGFEKEEVSENNIIDSEIIAETLKTDASINNENRFARLKRNLRKRSISIL